MTEKIEEKLKFGAETSKVLQLMIHALYTNKDIFLRELISNASDACDKLRYEALTKPGLIAEDAGLQISVTIDKDNRRLTIADNGIGMSREELIRNLGTIAKSGTQEFLSQLTGDGKKDLPLIGQFGVGFYSAFMVADRVTVLSTRAGSQESWRWESDGEGEFTISEAPRAARGTAITLHLKEGEDIYLDKFRLRHVVETYSDHISFSIELTDEEGRVEKINTASALWMRPRAEITPQQYVEFYHHIAHSPDEPWLTLHHRAEGKLEYACLLFIPSMRPFDLFHPDRKRRVKLYVKRVFITDENVDLVPQWLRFLRGVVDSEDLPLNISRETLQKNPLLAKIRENLVKRLLSELKKRADDNAQDYEIFWKNFGAALKEGLCEGQTPREQIFEVCRFHSSATGSLTGLDDYLSRMQQGQEHIFYLVGERVETLAASPQLEGFRKRGVEVLLLTDHVDDFWVNVATEYKGKSFKSVTRADIDLNGIGTEAEPEKAPPDAAPLIARFKAVLGEEVRDVRVTGKLTDSAVCLAVAEGAMDFRLERFLVEQKQLPGASAKILEVNIRHPIIEALAAKLSESAADAEIEDAVWLLFDQARVLEGENITDPAAFSRRLSQFVHKSLMAA